MLSSPSPSFLVLLTVFTETGNDFASTSPSFCWKNTTTSEELEFFFPTHWHFFCSCGFQTYPSFSNLFFHGNQFSLWMLSWMRQALKSALVVVLFSHILYKINVIIHFQLSLLQSWRNHQQRTWCSNVQVVFQETTQPSRKLLWPKLNYSINQGLSLSLSSK